MSNFLFNTGQYIHDAVTGIGANASDMNETYICDKENLTVIHHTSESNCWTSLPIIVELHCNLNFFCICTSNFYLDQVSRKIHLFLQCIHLPYLQMLLPPDLPPFSTIFGTSKKLALFGFCYSYFRSSTSSLPHSLPSLMSLAQVRVIFDRVVR